MRIIEMKSPRRCLRDRTGEWVSSLRLSVLQKEEGYATAVGRVAGHLSQSSSKFRRSDSVRRNAAKPGHVEILAWCILSVVRGTASLPLNPILNMIDQSTLP